MAGLKVKPSKEHIFLIAVLLFSFYLRILHIDGGFSEESEISIDVYGALNVSTVSILKWIDPNTYNNVLYHGPMNYLIIAFVSNLIFSPAILFSGAPYPLNIDMLQWEHSNQVYIIEPLFRGVILLLSLITIFLVYRIGKEYESNIGLISAFLLGTLSWYLIINYIIAPYTAVTLAISLSLFLFYCGIKNNRNNIVLISSVVAALSVYLTILALVIPLICLLYLYISKRVNQIPKKAIEPYAIILLVPAIIMVSIGGLRWAYGEFLGTFLMAAVKWEQNWMILWDPKNGIFTSVEHPLIYLDIFLDYLSPVFIFFAIIGVILAINHARTKEIAKTKEIDMLMLSWFFIGFAVLNILNAKTPRYPSILLPPLVIFAANGLMWLSLKLRSKQNIIKYSVISILLVFAVYSQPHLNNYINDKYVIVTDDAAHIYDFRIASDYINPNLTANDTVLYGGQRAFPWWYIKGNLSYDTTLDYWRKPDSKFVVFDQYAKEGFGTGGGPVWLDGNFGKGNIIIISFNIIEKIDILKKIASGKDIGIVFGDNKVKTALKNTGIQAEELGEKPLNEFIATHNLIIINSPSENNKQFFKKNQPKILKFLENGGTLLILNPKIRYIDWLPMETKVATQINAYDAHREHIPQNRIYLIGNNSEIVVNWTSFFYDYDKNYKEIALNSPVAMALYNNYTIEKIIRTHQQNWPLIYIYKKNI